MTTQKNDLSWDDVPLPIRDELKERGRPKIGQHAICETIPGQRWYFRGESYGWVLVGRDLDAARELVANDLTEEQREKVQTEVAAPSEEFTLREIPGMANHLEQLWKQLAEQASDWRQQYAGAPRYLGEELLPKRRTVLEADWSTLSARHIGASVRLVYNGSERVGTITCIDFIKRTCTVEIEGS
jgi:hypothetical protein